MAPKATRTLALRRPFTRSSSVLPRKPPDQPAPLSFGQEQIWLHSQLAPDVPLYSESLTVRHHGPLDPDALAGAFHDVVARHDIWRTTFVWSDGNLMQEVHPELEPALTQTDLRHLPPEERERVAVRHAAEDFRRPFELSKHPGVRARLVTLTDEDQRLFLCLHHMVFDGISIYRVFLPELAALYQAKLTGAASSLPQPPVQYADFAYWQRRSADETAFLSMLEYWRGRLPDAPTTLNLRPDHARPRRQSYRGGLVRFKLPVHLTAAVRRTARQEQCTVFMVLLAGFAATLHRWTGQADMLIGSVSGGRDRPELEHLIGYFLRMLILRLDLRNEPTFRELLLRTREVLLEALSRDALPFQRLVRDIAPERDLSRAPLFQVTFSIEPPLPALGAEWDLSEMDAGSPASKFDLSIELEDRGESVSGRAIYNLDLFNASTIGDLMLEYTAVLERAAAEPGQRLQDLAGGR